MDFLKVREDKARSQKADELFAMRDQLAAVAPPLGPEEIQTEIQTTRAERRARRDADRR